MIGVFFELELAWGFGVRYPQGTAVQMAPPLPPPSVAIGAIAESVAIQYGLGETIRIGKQVCSTAYAFAKATKAAAFALSPESPTGLIVKAEMLRIFQAMYLREKYKKDPNRWFGAQAFGQVYGPGAKLWMIVVFDDVLLRNELKNRGIRDELDTILEHVNVRRIGSKEGLVSVKKKIISEVTEERDVETFFYAPRYVVKRRNEGYSTDLLLWLPTKESFCEGKSVYELFITPSGPLSSQALLVPPKDESKIILNHGFCLKNTTHCVGVIHNE